MSPFADPLTLNFVVGLPGAGKSRFVDGLGLAAPWSDISSGFVSLRTALVRYDSIRKALGHVYCPASEPYVHAVACTMARTAFLDRYDVLIDESLTQISWAADLVNIAVEYGAQVHMAHIATAADICRSNRIPFGFPEADFDRKLVEWVRDGEVILGMADAVTHFVLSGDRFVKVSPGSETASR